jgi:singapore isolate B (sub-type 7) whole genome shotgun sequence assembly, scaffold_5
LFLLSHSDHLSPLPSEEAVLPLPLPVPSPRTIYVPAQLHHTTTGLPMVHKDGTPLGDAELVNVFKKRLDRKLRDAWQPSQEAQEEMLRRGVNSLVVASNDPLEDVPKLLPYLAPSGILVVYSQYQTLLAELFAGLKRSGQWINITMSESFMRKYQVLPMRTHPYMNMYNNSGFVLCATRILNTRESDPAKDMSGIRTGATFASTLKKKKLKLM